jgi:ATPase subunit of ABC transporter with duplicated ATPase domains
LYYLEAAGWTQARILHRRIYSKVILWARRRGFLSAARRKSLPISRRQGMSLFEIKCPLCKGTLWVDQSTGKVVDHKSADQKKTDFDDFVKQQKEKSSQWEDKFKKAAEEKAKRKAEIEQKFKTAKEKPDEIEGDYESPFKWD